MAVVLTEPFDTLTNWTGHGANLTIVTGGHTGNAAKFTGTTGGTNSYYNIAAGSQTDTLDVDWWFKPTSRAIINAVLQFLSDTHVTAHMTLVVNVNGSLAYMRGGTGGTVLATSATGLVTDNTWQHVRVRAKLHDTAGTYDVWHNGVNVITATGADTKNAGTKTVFDSVSIMNNVNAIDVMHDDMTVDNGVAAGPAMPWVWNGSAFVRALALRTWNGSAFVDATTVKTWNGSAFVDAV